MPPTPRPVHQVMVSSTFTDLEEHRAALIKALSKHKLHPNVMENDDAKVAHDVIESSLQMVRDSAAYILLIGARYGQIPKDPDRNPNNLSITELEFIEAQRLKRPTLVFIMGDDHPVPRSMAAKAHKDERRLNAFRERAKKKDQDSAVHRVYSVFDSLADFKDKIASSLSELCSLLPAEWDKPETDSAASPAPTSGNPIPKPPGFYAEPDYIGLHRFVGRTSQLQELSDWAKPDDPDSVLLFEAIGGNGKSMLTWEWTTRHATKIRPDWAGRFWYSFYERGAIMADFCQRALAYMTGRPLEEFRKKKTAELREPLLAQLHARPWLLILDGLERVLVAYHRIDAAEVADEEANRPTDKIANRNPCDAIRDEDNDLLRALAAAAPSKILVSSRLIPRVLLNPAGLPLPGVCPKILPGLDQADAEALLRSCHVSGNSAAIRRYLTTNCDNHPLVIGVLGGLINNYLPDRGNFDAWVADPEGGAKLDLASLDLIQRRNHILRAALDALPPKSGQLLATLALLSESVDYPTLRAFNPHLPPEPEEVEKPEPPEDHWSWARLTDDQKADRRKQYEADLTSWNDYEEAVKAWLASAEYREAPKKLAETVADLERRGLLQYDGRTKRYDLHPVVRGVAAGWMKADDRQRYGQRVVDHFSSLPHSPYENAETLEDLRAGLHVVRTLLKLGQFQQAADVYRGDLAEALSFNVEAYAETLSLLRPFFPAGWGELPNGVAETDASYLANDAASSLDSCGEPRQALAAYSAALRSCLERKDWVNSHIELNNFSYVLISQNLLAKSLHMVALALDLAVLIGDAERLFTSQLRLFDRQSQIGRWAEAEATWQFLDPMGRGWSRTAYRPGEAEFLFSRFQFWLGTLREDHLAMTESLAAEGKNRSCIRSLHGLRGDWRLEQGEWALAVASYHEAVRMARERGNSDTFSETGLALAKFHLGQLAEPEQEAERLAQMRWPAHRLLAQLWLAIGDPDRAKPHALAAYKSAWADGEPYVNRHALTRTTELLGRMNVPIPNLPPYDPAREEKFPWEDDVAAAIAKLRAEKEAKNKGDGSTERPT